MRIDLENGAFQAARLALYIAAFRRRGRFSTARGDSAQLHQEKTKMAKAAAKAAGKKSSTKLTKAGLITAIAEGLGEETSRKQVKSVLEALTDIGYKELKKNGIFVLPGFAKYVVVKRPARPAREGINPFTKQPTTFPAKKASNVVRARPVKALKDAIAS
jgi:DNA-binding protein HU-beta